MVTVLPRMEDPRDFVWDMESRLFWMTEMTEDRGRVFKIRTNGTKVGEPIDIEDLTPDPVALNPESRQLSAVVHISSLVGEPQGSASGEDDSALHPMLSRRFFFIRKSKQPPVTGFAIRGTGDAKRGWSCRGGGLCATIEVRDANDELLWSFYPRCEPIDLNFDPDGRRLWIVAGNGPGQGAVLLERLLVDTADESDFRESAMRTTRFLALPVFVQPAAIVSTGSSVWVLDRTGQPAAFGHRAKPRLYEFDVGPRPE
jgi:hypothetical protein